MDYKTARWMQVIRFSPEQVAHLHKIEYDANNQGRNWWIAVSYYIDELNLGLGDYWSRNKSESERASETERYEKQIYPIWAGLYRKYQNGQLSEIEWIHQADKAIHASKYEINTGLGDKRPVTLGY